MARHLFYSVEEISILLPFFIPETPYREPCENASVIKLNTNFPRLKMKTLLVTLLKSAYRR